MDFLVLHPQNVAVRCAVCALWSCSDKLYLSLKIGKMAQPYRPIGFQAISSEQLDKPPSYSSLGIQPPTTECIKTSSTEVIAQPPSFSNFEMKTTPVDNPPVSNCQKVCVPPVQTSGYSPTDYGANVECCVACCECCRLLTELIAACFGGN